MPNGGGVLFGCFLCQHFIKHKENPLFGHCIKHDIDTNMSFICKDMLFHKITEGNIIHRWFLAFQRKQLVKYHTHNLEPNMLYFYSEVTGLGYPPPIEKVAFAPIENCKNITEETRQHLIEKANATALEQYQKRLSK